MFIILAKAGIHKPKQKWILHQVRNDKSDREIYRN